MARVLINNKSVAFKKFKKIFQFYKLCEKAVMGIVIST